MAEIIVTTSKQFTLNVRDLLRGFLMTAGGAIIAPLIESLKDWSFVANWHTIVGGALTAGLTYLLKNFFQPSQTIIASKPPLDIPDTPIGGNG